MTQTCTDADAHNDTELHYLFNYPHIIPELHAYTHTDRSCSHTGMHSRTYFFCPATKVLHKSNYRCFHDDLNHFLMQPLDAVVREEISFLNHLRFCLFIMDSSWCFSSLPLSPLTFHQRGNNQRLGKEKKKKQLVNYKKRDIGRGRRGERRGSVFLKYVVFGFFLGPLSLTVLSLLRLSGFQMDAF